METKQPIKMQSIINPTSEDLHFKYDSAEYVLKAGEKKELVDYVAKLAAKKLADKNSMTADPDERKVLMTAYLENSDIETVARNLNINLDKIRAEKLSKEKEKARMINLESVVAEQNKKIEALMNKMEEKEVKTDKRTKEYKESLKNLTQ